MHRKSVKEPFEESRMAHEIHAKKQFNSQDEGCNLSCRKHTAAVAVSVTLRFASTDNQVQMVRCAVTLQTIVQVKPRDSLTT